MSPLVYAARPILIDMAATLVFYGVLATTGDVAVATGVGIVLGLAQVAVMKLRRRRIAAMQWTALALVVIMGGATLLTHDARFVLFKATIVYVAIGAAMLERGWMGRYMPPIAQGRIPQGYVIGAGYVWAGLMFASALLNLGLTMTAQAKTTAAVMSIWAPASKAALFAAQYLLFRSVARRSAPTVAA
ncbi:septation protein IspZ [Phenylobacterium sp.]|uniref:inner membrane-spanning protein YciB n=1 Tax=Phenylobacterium sp. TaxID=1871053 RepID=UPI00289CA1BB|nr:septation protein IspZ [Phenylobacterium sp.]